MARSSTFVTTCGLAIAVALAVPSVAQAQDAPPPPADASGGAPAPSAAPSPGPAPADGALASAAIPERHGLFGGFGLFGGNISCNGSDCGGFREAGGASGHIGFVLNPRLAALVDVWGMTSSKNNVSITFVSATVGVRYWLAPAFWVQGGLGSGHAVVRVGGLQGRGDDVPVGELAAGLELARGHSWAIDVAAKVAQGSSTNNNGTASTGRSAGIGANITWFGMR